MQDTISAAATITKKPLRIAVPQIGDQLVIEPVIAFRNAEFKHTIVLQSDDKLKALRRCPLRAKSALAHGSNQYQALGEIVSNSRE
jgi:hypothetical protein